jgi:SAM-dependent methyltransferase
MTGFRAEPVSLESNVEWRRWGKEDPLWAVATEPGRKRGEGAAWTDAEFYGSGASDWQDFFERWRQYGLNLESCLEIGCGAGRITKHLSLRFQKVHAIDVSPGMIAYAKNALAAENVEFCLTGGLDLPQANRSVKAIFSTHVLQHLDNVEVVLAFFREFFRVLDAGGTIMVHVPLYEWPGTGRIAILLRMIHAVLLKISEGLAWVKRRTHVRLMRATACHAPSLHVSLTDMGFKDIEFRTFATSRNGVLHSFVLARK